MQAGVDASVLQEATKHFESRLHTAAAMYVQALHSLPITSTVTQSTVQAPDTAADRDIEAYSAEAAHGTGAVRVFSVLQYFYESMQSFSACQLP